MDRLAPMKNLGGLSALAGFVSFVERLPFAQRLPCHTAAQVKLLGYTMTVFMEWPMNRIFSCLSSYVLRNGFGKRGNYTLSQKIEE